MKVYQYLPDLKIVREKPEMEKPTIKDLKYWNHNGTKPDFELLGTANKMYAEHLASLATYPASGFGKEHEGRELVEGVHFKVEYYFREGLMPNNQWKLIDEDWYKRIRPDYRKTVAVPLDNSPQPTEQPEVLYRWVKASERKPGNMDDVPLWVNSGFELGWYDKTKNRWFTDSDLEFTNDEIKWLEPLPSQPGESVDALAQKEYPYPENDLYKEGDSDLMEMTWTVDKCRAAFKKGFAASHPSPSVDAEPSPQEAAWDDLIEDFELMNRLGVYDQMELLKKMKSKYQLFKQQSKP